MRLIFIQKLLGFKKRLCGSQVCRETRPIRKIPPFLFTLLDKRHYRIEAQHHHVPVLLSPFGYTTYRGS